MASTTDRSSITLSQTALLLIDNQNGFTHPTHWNPPNSTWPPNSRSNPLYETNLTHLLTNFRTINSTPKPLIVHVAHHSLDPLSALHPSASNAAAVAFLPFAQPLQSSDELVMTKNVNSSFIGTELESVLRTRGIRRLIIAGLTTDHCVSTTTRMAANLHVTHYTDDEGKESKGEVILVEDACATFPRGEFDAETVHRVQIESLRGEFCDVLTTTEVIERFLS